MRVPLPPPLPLPDIDASPSVKAAYILDQCVRAGGRTHIDMPSRRQRKQDEVRYACEVRIRHQSMDLGTRRFVQDMLGGW